MTMYRSPGAVDSWNYGAPPVAGVATGNRGSFARFFHVAVKNHADSQKAGSDVFGQEVHVQILMPGDALSAPIRRVKLADGQIIGKEWIDGYPKEWAAFNEGREQIPDGMPLDKWPRCNVGVKATLNAIHIYTVEQLAEANESALEKIGMGARVLQAEARAFVETARDSAANQKLAAEAELARQDRDAMFQRLQDMEQRLAMITQSKAVLDSATQPAPPATTLDDMSRAAVASGGVPVDADALRAMANAPRGPGRPRKQQ